MEDVSATPADCEPWPRNYARNRRLADGLRKPRSVHRVGRASRIVFDKMRIVLLLAVPAEGEGSHYASDAIPPRLHVTGVISLSALEGGPHPR